MTFIGLNPSTADETTDDPTIRRCVGFARRWGFARLKMVNLYALRATDPKALYAIHGDIVGLDNDCTLAKVIGGSDLVVCAWGTHASHIDGFRASRVLRLIAAPHCLGRNKDGSPKHPLYLPADTDPQPFGFLPVGIHPMEGVSDVSYYTASEAGALALAVRERDALLRVIRESKNSLLQAHAAAAVREARETPCCQGNSPDRCAGYQCGNDSECATEAAGREAS